MYRGSQHTRTYATADPRKICRPASRRRDNKKSTTSHHIALTRCVPSARSKSKSSVGVVPFHMSDETNGRLVPARRSLDRPSPRRRLKAVGMNDQPSPKQTADGAHQILSDQT